MTVNGTFASLSGSTVTLSHDGDPDTTHSIPGAASVTLNGKPVTLTDLRAGDEVTLDGPPITKVEATR